MTTNEPTNAPSDPVAGELDAMRLCLTILQNLPISDRPRAARWLLERVTDDATAAAAIPDTSVPWEVTGP